MYGTNRTNGKEMQGVEHVRQSIADILTTRIGSRPWRRDYGSNLQDMIDAPVNPLFLASVFHETAEALERWEPRFELNRVSLANITPKNGFVSLILSGTIDLGKGTGTIASQALPVVTFDVAVGSAATSTNNTAAAANTRPVVEYAPAIMVTNGETVVTLASLPHPAYPLQMAFNGVLYDPIARDGNTARYAYDGTGDVITAYYYVQGASV